MMKLAPDLSVLSIHRSALARALPVAVLAFAGGAGLAFLPGQLRAQEMTSREVVQPLPSGEVQRLNRALMRLAGDPRDLAALLEAGEASLKVDDFEAASGFFARAVTVAPDHPRGRLGLARVYLKSGEAPQALDQFARATEAGAAENELLSDRALAHDLVGDQGKAQTGYLRALELTPGDAEARRRLAVSFAISGNRAGFEDTLRPLLDQRDVAALRTRAFGLAIMGDQDRAALIVEQAMPRDLSSRLIPYLAFMPRLTRPQQAAAANLGIFPRAADIGRDDPRLARFAEEAKADSRLEPAGAPLGGATAEGNSAGRARSRGRANSPSQPGVVAASSRSARRAAGRNAPAPQPADGTGAAAPVPLPSPPAAVAVAVAAPASVSAPAPATVQRATAPAVAASGPEAAASVPAMAAAASGIEIAAAPSATAAPLPPPPAPPPPAPSAPLRVADAFADLGDAVNDPRVGAEAVDISRIAVRREVAAPAPEPAAPKELPKPVHPSRHWVQIATGRDVDALRFDWRRLERSGGDLFKGMEPHITPWGAANRLLVGPVANREKARDLVKQLKEKGIDTFSYISPKGEEIQTLK